MASLTPANDNASECSEIIGMRDLPFLGCHRRVAEMSLSPKCRRNVSVTEMSLSPKVIPRGSIGSIILGTVGRIPSMSSAFGSASSALSDVGVSIAETVHGRA